MALGTRIKEVAARLRCARTGVTLYCSFCGKSQHKVAKLDCRTERVHLR